MKRVQGRSERRRVWLEELESREVPASADLDRAFGGDGRVTTSFGGEEAANAVFVLGDGRIVTAGTVFNQFAVARFLPDGRLDTSFSGDGLATLAVGNQADRAFAVDMQPDGKIVLAGFTTSAQNGRDLAVARFNVDGSLDTGFGTNGFVATDVAGNDDTIFTVKVLNDGRILAGGTAAGGPDSGDFVLARYTAAGALDLSFSSDGLVT
ncbi:MAG: delta-60 repeat domain-containing protein, partial [Planctomycetia bacterium]